MSKTVITRRLEIDMGHRVPNHKSKCRNLHGHRYVFEVGLSGEISSSSGSSNEGMVCDFGDIKDLLMRVIHDPYDHGLMLYEKDPIAKMLLNAKECEDQKIILVPFIPTAENIVSHVFRQLKEQLSGEEEFIISYVKVWETPNATATCYNS